MRNIFDALFLVAGLLWLTLTDKAEEKEMLLQFGEIKTK